MKKGHDELITLRNADIGRLKRKPVCLACGKSIEMGKPAKRVNCRGGGYNYICGNCIKKPVLVYPIRWNHSPIKRRFVAAKFALAVKQQ